MNICEEFYSLRDMRTEQYINNIVPDIAVHVAIEPKTAYSESGQHLLLSLANMLCRVHKKITFNIPADVPLKIPCISGKSHLVEALLYVLNSINPCGSFTIEMPTTEEKVLIAIGPMVDRQYHWYLGADRSIAFLQSQPVEVKTEYKGTMRGAALAACLGASAAFKMAVQYPVVPRKLSIWNYREDNEADPGFEELTPVNVGSVLLVGAGAVASSLVYWLHVWGTKSKWTIVDGDNVQLHNINRGLLFTAADAGWLTSTPLNKAQVVAGFLQDASFVSKWYDMATEIKDIPFDIILALANERNVRTKLAHRNAPVLLHATTGENWLSQLHRHVAGTDDCIECRTNEVVNLHLGCSVGTIPTTKNETESNDAALPFLSATSGLMLATLLQRLEAGVLMDDFRNDWRFDFLSTERMASAGKRHCREGCAIWQPLEVRRCANKGNRWLHLDK